MCQSRHSRTYDKQENMTTERKQHVYLKQTRIKFKENRISSLFYPGKFCYFKIHSNRAYKGRIYKPLKLLAPEYTINYATAIKP